MKTLCVVPLLMFLTSGVFFAQEPVRPTIGVVAIIRESDRNGVSLQLANQLTSAIGKDKRGLLLKSETIQLHSNSVNDGALAEIARGRGVNWLAVVDYQAGMKSRGVFTVEMARASAEKIISKTAVLMGILVDEADRLGTQIARIVENCVGDIGAIVRQNVAIRVLLDLCVKPATGKADYILGTADMRSTNELGLDKWPTVLPVGKTVLKVMRSGFKDGTIEVDVPWTKEIYVIRRIIELRP